MSEKKYKAIVTSKGQLTIPKELRDSFNIRKGSAVIFEKQHNGQVVFYPAEFDEMNHFEEKLAFIQKLLNGDRVIIIDPENNVCQQICEQLGGLAVSSIDEILAVPEEIKLILVRKNG